MQRFRGSIVSIPADNLGSHSIGGFKEGFTALRPCRYCTATRDDSKLKVGVYQFMHASCMHYYLI